MPQAVVRQHIQRIAGVTRTWFEWTWEDSTWVLVSQLLGQGCSRGDDTPAVASGVCPQSKIGFACLLE